MTHGIMDTAFREPKSSEKTLKPVIYLSWLMGTGICSPGDWRKVTIVLKCFHLSICSAIVVYGIEDFITITKTIWSEAYLIMHVMNKTLIYTASYYYVIFGIFHQKKWQRFVKNFESLDEKIRKEISINDRPTKVRQIMAIVVIALLGPLPLISHLVYYHLTDPRLINASDLFFYYTITQSLVTNFEFDIIVYRIHQRLKIVNKLISQIGNPRTAPWIMLKIQRLRDLHFGICNLVNILNETHGVHLLLSSANSFLVIVVTLFRIYIRMSQSDLHYMLMYNFVWMVYAVQFWSKCYVCTLATFEARKTGVLIQEVALKNNRLTNKHSYNCNFENGHSLSFPSKVDKSDELGSCLQDEIVYFSSQLQQNPVVFSACEFFELNNSLFQGFIGVISTYLIILIQFCHPRNT